MQRAGKNIAKMYIYVKINNYPPSNVAPRSLGHHKAYGEGVRDPHPSGGGGFGGSVANVAQESIQSSHSFIQSRQRNSQLGSAKGEDCFFGIF